MAVKTLVQTCADNAYAVNT